MGWGIVDACFIASMVAGLALLMVAHLNLPDRTA